MICNSLCKYIIVEESFFFFFFFFALFLFCFWFFVCFLFLFFTTWHNWALTAETKKNYFEAADEVAPRKRLTSLLKVALDLIAEINWAVDGRNDLAWLTRFDLGTSTARLLENTLLLYFVFTGFPLLSSYLWITRLFKFFNTQYPFPI